MFTCLSFPTHSPCSHHQHHLISPSGGDPHLPTQHHLIHPVLVHILALALAKHSMRGRDPLPLASITQRNAASHAPRAFLTCLPTRAHPSTLFLVCLILLLTFMSQRACLVQQRRWQKAARRQAGCHEGSTGLPEEKYRLQKFYVQRARKEENLGFNYTARKLLPARKPGQ